LNKRSTSWAFYLFNLIHKSIINNSLSITYN
jgi:hypothetical protein